MPYTTVYEIAQDSFTEKKSRFIGHIAPVESEEAALQFISSIKAINRKAKHNVYAYILRDGNLSRYSDDGEPQGTAGVPVLDVLQKSGLTDVCVVITRYFGGVLLGANGLVRAYSTACSLAVTAAGIKTMCECSEFTMACTYSVYGKAKYAMPDYQVKIIEEKYAENVTVTVKVKKELCEKFRSAMVNITNGQILLLEKADLWDDFAV